MGLKGDNLGREEGWWVLKVGTWEGRRGIGLKEENLGREESMWTLVMRIWAAWKGVCTQR